MRATIVIPAADRAAANADAVTVDPAAGETFYVGLCTPSDMETTTHYWCSWGGLTADQFAALAALFDGVGGRRMFDGDPVMPEAVLAECGLVRQAMEDA